MGGRITPVPKSVARPVDFTVGLIDRLAEIRVDAITPSPFQRRSASRDEAISSLAESISDIALSSPILVRPTPTNGRYELVCGEGRWRAHQLLQREYITAVIRFMSDQDALKVHAADNLQRQELSDWEVCQTILQLIEHKVASTDSALGHIIGRPRSYVTKVRAFCDLPVEAANVVRLSPSLFGCSLAAELRASGYNTSHPALVTDALSAVATGALTQSGVMSWLRSRIAPPAASQALKDTTIVLNNRRVRIVAYQDTVRISCKGMDSLQFEKRLRAALDTLL